MDIKKNKILIFATLPPPNTGQTIATKLIFQALQKYYSIDVIDIADPNRLKRSSGAFSLNYFFNLINKYWQLIGALRRHKYDLAYMVYAPSKLALVRDVIATFFIKKLSKAKLIVHIHSGNYGINFKSGVLKFFFNYVLRKADKIIFLSPRLNTINYLAVGKVGYLTNMISDDVSCSDEEVEIKISERENRQRLNICYISNMINEKGYNDLVDAISFIDLSTIPLKVHLVGGWPSDEAKNLLIRKIDNAGINDVVEIHGPIHDRAIIKSFFLEADIFVLPTYYPIEAQPLSIIEAFNAGTPVISTDHASIPDMVDDGENGYIVKPRSPEEIAAGIKLLWPYENWRSKAEAARGTYLRKYHPDVIMPQLLNFFEFNEIS